MVFPVVGGDGKPTGYEIENSLRFWNGDYLKDTSFGTGTNRKKFTFSYWIKPTDLDTGGNPSLVYSNDSNDHIGFDGDNKFIFADSGSIILKTNRVFKDVSAWYHIVLAVDTTQGTAGNRYKLYVNGTQETSLETDAGISQNTDLNFHNNETHSIGRNQNDGTDFLYAYLSEFHAIDGQQLDASYFGETNDNGVWVPKEYTGTYGNNGIFMEFKQSGTGQSSSSMGADTSGNDNHFVTVALDATNQTTDTPTNNFATLNPLNVLNGTLSEGNTQFVRAASGTANSVSTICPSNGKWYMEFQNSAAQNSAIGVVNVDAQAAGTNIYPYTYAAAILLETNLIATILYDEVASDGETQRSTASGAGTTKIGMAVDLDNQDIYISTNGQWWGGSSFNQGTGPGTALITDLPTTGFAAGFYINGTIINACYYNFGNPGGADSISSGNADANGYGNFEYEVPSGFYSLCTKNLAEFG